MEGRCLLNGAPTPHGLFPAELIPTGAYQPTDVRSVDINNDGREDLVYLGTNSSTGAGAVFTRIADGSGQWIHQDGVPWTVGANPKSLAVGNIDGVNGPDLACFSQGDGKAYVLRNAGNGTFAVSNFGLPTGTTGLDLGDLNGDGLADLVASVKPQGVGWGSVSTRYGNPDGGFSGPWTTPLTGSPDKLVLGDLDGDGRADAVVVDQQYNSVALLYRATGNALVVRQEVSLPGKPYSAAIGNVLGPAGSRNEIVTFNADAGSVSVLGDPEADGLFSVQGTFDVDGAPASGILADLSGDPRAEAILAEWYGIDVTPFADDLAGSVPGLEVSTGTEPQSVAVGDYNDDGHRDVVTANPGDKSLSLLPGQEPATFGQATQLEGFQDIKSTGTADLNGDGYDDAVTFHTSPTEGDRMGVVFGGPGGLSGQTTWYPLDNVYRGNSTIADFNGDQKPDIVVDRRDGNTTVLLNQGDGTFQTSVLQSNVYRQTSFLHADLNGDGHQDLIAVQEPTEDKHADRVTIYYGGPGELFGQSVTCQLTEGVKEVQVGDVNGDGKPDLVSISAPSPALPGGHVEVLINQGDGTFQRQVVATSDSWLPSRVFVADFNGDGHKDAAVADLLNKSLLVYPGGPSGLSSSPTSYQIPKGTGGNFAGAVGDFNGDSLPDLVVTSRAEGYVNAFQNRGDGTFAPAVVYRPQGQSLNNTIARDVDGDGFFDLVVTMYADEKDDDRVYVYHGGLQGLSSTPEVYHGGENPIAAIGDFNADLRPDLLTASAVSNNLYVLPNQGDKVLQAPAQQQTSDNPSQLLPFNYNSDGLGDLFWLNRTAGTLSIVPGHADNTLGRALDPIQVGPSPVHASTGDVNGDGREDILVANAGGGGSVSLTLNEGNGSFDVLTHTLPSAPSLSHLADLNKDGFSDALVLTPGADELRIMFGSAAGLSGGWAVYATGDNPQSLATPDLNGDSYPDMVLTNRGGSSVWVRLNQGNGSFAAQAEYPVVSGPQQVVSGDLNGDNWPDLAVFSPGFDVFSVLMNQGNGTFGAATNYTCGTAETGFVNDVDGDGDQDVAVVTFGGHVIAVLKNNGNGTLAPRETFETGTALVNPTMGDINGDRRPDLVATSADKGQTKVMVNLGDGRFSLPATFPGGEAGLVLTDLNGDGRPDVATVSNQSSQLWALPNLTPSRQQPENSHTIGLYDPSASMFYLRNSNTTGDADYTFGFGAPSGGWVPLAGDWDGDGKDSIGLYDPAASVFYLRNSNTAGNADYTFGFDGTTSGWVPLAGDWNGDGKDSVGLYDPTTSVFYLRNSLTTGNADVTFGFGTPGAGWNPIAGDWDGDGQDTVGRYDPVESVFQLRNSNTPGVADVSFGYGTAGSGWAPLAGDWDGDGRDSVGLFDPSESTFFLTNSNAPGTADMTFGYGTAGSGWTPLAGHWGDANQSPLSLAGVEPTPLPYTENDPAAPVTAAITVRNQSGPNLTRATIQITGNYQKGQDVLSFAGTKKINGKWNAKTGTLTLSGKDTVANYQAALRSVRYRNTSENPSAAERTVTFQVGEGKVVSNKVTRSIAVAPVNDPPVLAKIGSKPLAFTEKQTPKAISPTVKVSDLDHAKLAGATVQITDGYRPKQDVLVFTQIPRTSITGTWDPATGTMTLAGSDTVANYQKALRAVKFKTGADPGNATRTVTFITTDGSTPSNAVVRQITVKPVNDAPVLGAIEKEPLAYATGQQPTTMTGTITAADADHALLAGATLQITRGYKKGQDILAFQNTDTITGIFDAMTGKLTLSGNATAEAYQAALRAVTYQNTSATPNTATRTVTFKLFDGAAYSKPLARAIEVTADSTALRDAAISAMYRPSESPGSSAGRRR